MITVRYHVHGKNVGRPSLALDVQARVLDVDGEEVLSVNTHPWSPAPGMSEVIPTWTARAIETAFAEAGWRVIREPGADE